VIHHSIIVIKTIVTAVRYSSVAVRTIICAETGNNIMALPYAELPQVNETPHTALCCSLMAERTLLLLFGFLHRVIMTQ
jgi:hypothetical protein